MTTANLVEQFRCALEACEAKHTQAADATPCATAPPLQPTTRVTFANPVQGSAESVIGGGYAGAVLSPLTEPILPPMPASVPPAYNVLTQTVPDTVVPIKGTGQPVVAAKTSTARIILYVAIAIALATAVYVAKRRFMPSILCMVGGTANEDAADSDVEEDLAKRKNRTQGARMRQPTQPSGHSAMAAYIKSQQMASTNQVPPQRAYQPPSNNAGKSGASSSSSARGEAQKAKVDLRAVRFIDEAPEAPEAAGMPPLQEDPGANFFESEEDPNFVPL